jgi:NTE family protein
MQRTFTETLRARDVLLAITLAVLLGLSPLLGQDQARPKSWTIEPATEQAPGNVPQLIPCSHLVRARLGLVLSGGGSRGAAAIGVLKAFERHGVPVDLIVGTSIGGIIGGLYAAGYSTANLETVIDTTNWNDVLSLAEEQRREDLYLDQKLAADRSVVVLRFNGFQPVLPSALSTGQRLTNLINVLTLQAIYHPHSSFDELRIPFRCVTTDLVSGRRVVLQDGSLSEALRATATVPLLFNPVERDSLQLIDGGLVSNIPVDVAILGGADLTVAVDVTSPLRPAERLVAPWEVADQIIGIMAQYVNEEQRSVADVVITPDIGNHLSSDFTGLDSLIRLGEEAAERAIPKILTLYTLRFEEQLAAIPEGRTFEHARVRYEPSVLSQQWRSALENLAPGGHVSEGALKRLATRLLATDQYVAARFVVSEFDDSTVVELKADLAPVIRSIHFEGNTLVPDSLLAAVIQPLLGRRPSIRESKQAVEGLLAVYRDLGYSLARILSISFSEATGEALVVFDEGVIRDRIIRGPKKTKNYVLRRELPFQEGDVFKSSQVDEALRNLYGTNLLQQISIGVELTDSIPPGQNVVIEATERTTELIRFGLRIDNERNVQPSIDVRDENFLGTGSELGAHFFGGLRNRDYVGEFKANRIFDSYLTFNLRAYYSLKDFYVYGDAPSSDPKSWERVELGEYRTVRSGFSLAFGTQLERLGMVTVEGRFENQQVWNLVNEVIEPQDPKIAALRFGITIDTRDRYPFPRKGVALEFTHESALFRLGGTPGFSKTSLTYENYRSLGERHSLSPRLAIGFGDETVPITEQYSIGGQDLFYGLRENDRLGRQLLVASLEYRYRSHFSLFFDTYIRLRYDLGTVWENAEKICLSDLRHGVGVGLALDTPIGPAEFSVGRSFYLRTDLAGSPVSFGPVLLYFSIGSPF